MNENQIEQVDIFGNPAGCSCKQEVHRFGLLHRAFSIFIVRKEDLLIQKRAADKYHSGGLWSNTCCSHPAGREHLLNDARQRLSDEMGIICPLQEIFHFIYYHRFSADLIEYEFDHVLIGLFDGPFTPNPDEAEEARWINFADLAVWMARQPELFTPWFLIAAPQVMEIVRSLYSCDRKN